MHKNRKFGFVGGGQMAEAIFSGMLLKKAVPPQNICVGDINEERLLALEKQYAVNTLPTAGEGAYRSLAEGCDVLVLAVKPQVARAVLCALAPFVRKEQCVISIMGGITLDFLEELLPGSPVLRVMPNTPMLVGRGVAGISAGKNAKEPHIALCEQLFNLVGSSFVLDEKLMDPLTAVSGCGPAYAYMFIEALADGGVEKGLPREMAQQLAAQMLRGAAQMVLQTGKHPGQLKDSVTSPGGSTIAGVHALEDGGFRAAVMGAVDKSCERMKEIGKNA